MSSSILSTIRQPATEERSNAMDSSSEWDSLSGGEVEMSEAKSSVMEAPIVKKAQPPNTTPEHKQSPSFRQPFAKQNSFVKQDSFVQQDSNARSPRSPAHLPSSKNVPRVADQYRNMRSGGATTFKDRGGDEVATSNRQDSNNRHFKEVELEDRSYKNKPQPPTVHTGKRNNPVASPQENLPYVNFEANGTEQSSPYLEHDDRTINNKRQRKAIKQEYVSTTPVPNVAINQGKRSSWDSQNEKQNSVVFANKNIVLGKGKKHGGDQMTDINQNFESDHGENTGDEFTWNDDDNDDGKIKKKDNKKRKKPADSVKEKRKHGKGSNKGANKPNVEDYDESLEHKPFITGVMKYYYEEVLPDHHSVYLENRAIMPNIADKAETFMKRGWQEFFGALQIIVDFVVIFIVEFIKFLFKEFVQKLVSALLLTFGDYFLKPLLNASFNGLFQPLFILLWNIMHALQTLFQPVLRLTRILVEQIAVVLRAFRLFEVNWKTNSKSQLCDI